MRPPGSPGGRSPFRRDHPSRAAPGGVIPFFVGRYSRPRATPRTAPGDPRFLAGKVLTLRL
jgi:hypothetical protein